MAKRSSSGSNGSPWAWWRSPSDPQELDRQHWLSERGITPMNRSTRLWDMEITAHKRIPHRIERVGSLDTARRQIREQSAGFQVAPLKWEGSTGMATGKAYDWCTCIEAARPGEDGRTACVCQCEACAPPKESGRTATHFNKRNQEHLLKGARVRRERREHKLHNRIRYRIEYWIWWWRTRDTNGDSFESRDSEAPTVPLDNGE